MNDDQLGYIVIASAIITSMILGLIIGTLITLDLSNSLPNTFGFDAPIQGMNESIKIYLEDFNNAEYICKK